MRAQRGSATVAAVGVLGVILALGIGLAAIVGHARDRADARAGADLSALAGAGAARGRIDGQGEEPCRAAARAAEANDVTLASCRVFDDDSVQVVVERGRAVASARAGPAARRGSG